MSPKEITFKREAVLRAAVDIVRKEGWEHLTARRVARRLKASVAPVYSGFGSMAALEREVLKEARRRLQVATDVAYTDSAFLNIGVGMVAFARDESHLFRALFHTRHNDPDIIEGIYASILERMKADPFLRLFLEASLRRLLQNLAMYTNGLATSIVYERREDPSTDNIIRALKNAGNMMMYAELSGLADCDSPESEREWRRILAEKKIVLPEPVTSPRPPARRREKTPHRSS
jgi:AcrR family transcriptional regulator